MAFQFLCPQGHLLQGEEAHVGMQTQCPYCGVLFLIPIIEAPTNESADASQIEATQSPESTAVEASTFTEPSIGDFLAEVASAEPETAAVETMGIRISTDTRRATVHESAETLLHIPCPNGHELESPCDMLGQEVLCPHCRVQFRLRNEDSREHHEQLEKLEQQRNKFWFNWAMAAAVIIGSGLLAMVLIAMNR